MPISRSDENTIENWLLRDIRKYIFGIGEFFSEWAEIVLARP